MKNEYPCYRVTKAWNKDETFRFEKSNSGLEAAIQFAHDNDCNHVTCHVSPNVMPELVWEPCAKNQPPPPPGTGFPFASTPRDVTNLSGAMVKAAEKSQVIKLRGVNGAPITSYKQTVRELR